ncbi:MAG: DUF4145 domain-containing protein [Acidithiobacillus sp.]
MPTKKSKTVKAHCPTCNGERTCIIHGQVNKSWDWADKQGHSINGGDNHSLLECCGCETVFYERSNWNSEDMDLWYDEEGRTCGEPTLNKSTYPKPESRQKPKWLDSIAGADPQIANILIEMYTAYDNESYILTAVGLRTALDRGTEILGIDPAISFEEKLDSLKKAGWIGDTEREILGIVTDVGNAAAHRGWEPNAQQIAQLLSALEIFLQKSFIVGKEALNIKEKIPPKPKRKNKEKSDI